MNEVEFKNWLAKNNTDRKVQSDILSRLRRIEHEIENCDLDKEYTKDRCKHLMSLFDRNGENSELRQLNTSLPIGKAYIVTYKHAVKKYADFSKSL